MNGREESCELGVLGYERHGREWSLIVNEFHSLYRIDRTFAAPHKFVADFISSCAYVYKGPFALTAL